MCCDDAYLVTPRVSALAGCNILVSEPGYREVEEEPIEEEPLEEPKQEGYLCVIIEMCSFGIQGGLRGSFEFVLELLKKKSLFAKFSKCEFCLQEANFLRHVVNSNGIHVDPSKIEAMENWKASKTPSEILSFLGLAGKANVVADALSRKEIVKPKRVQAMSMTIQSSLKEKLLAA
ncbi:hypothetical protein Tco_1343839 [Tanacetum coccineum]